MREVELLILVTFLLHTTSGESTDDRRYNALKFGQTQNDYIIYQPDMGPFETGFTVCTWLRKLWSSGVPTWFSYAVSDQAFEIEMSDMGGETFIFGDESTLTSLYTVSPGTWFHNCLGWDSASQTRNVYINGVLVDSKATPAGRTLKQGGYLVLGNEQDSGPGAGMDNSDIFGGEMYKLNVFSKKLSDAEIQEMARDRCSEVEELYGEVRSIRWEDVLLKTRTGTVTEIGTGCQSVIIQQLRGTLQQTEEKLNETLGELERAKEEKNTSQADLETKVKLLNATEMQLTRTEEGMETCQKNLESKEYLLNETGVELEQTKEEKETYRADLESKVQQLNATEVELEQTKEGKQNCRIDLKNNAQQLNATETQKLTTIDELNRTTKELNSTTTTLNQTQAELEQVKDLLEKAVNATPDCPLNSTVTSHWDLLYSEEFFGGVITAHKLEFLRKSMQKLEYFEGIRITDGMIRFFKLFHDGEEQCPN